MRRPAPNDGSDRAAALDALAQLLEPIVELLLELGISSSEAEDALRDAFVKTASRIVAEETGRPQASLVALRCGLYRSEIKRRQARLGSPHSRAEATDPEPHRLNRLLRGWHTDPEFTQLDGAPRELARRGKKSFESLSNRYAANLYPAVVLNELKRTGAVARMPDGRLRVLQSEYRATGVSEANLRELGRQASDLLRAVIDGTQHSDADSLFAVAEGLNIDPRFLPLLRKTVGARVQTFMKLLDEQLNDQTMRGPEPGASLSVVVVGTRGFGRSQIAPPTVEGVAASANESGNQRKRRATTRARSSSGRR